MKSVNIKGVGFIVAAALCAFVVQYYKLKQESPKSKWFASIPLTTARNGVLETCDKQGLPIEFAWKRTSLQALDFSEITKSVSEIAIQAYTSVETQFLQGYPQAVLEDENLKSFAPLFTDGVENIDWNLVENQQQAQLKSIFEMDLTNLAPEVIATLPQDIYFFVTVKDIATSKLLGFIQFAVAPYYAFGDVKVITIAVAPTEQNRGLGKFLMTSVFKIIPGVQRIFLSTRPTNNIAIKAYQAWGFTPDDHPVEDPHWKAIENHWIYFEYSVAKNDILQKTASFLR